MAYLLIKNDGYTDGRIWKTKAKVRRHISAVIRNNSLEQRQMTGFVNMKIKKVKALYPKQQEELKHVKDFIWA